MRKLSNLEMSKGYMCWKQVRDYVECTPLTSRDIASKAKISKIFTRIGLQWAVSRNLVKVHFRVTKNLKNQYFYYSEANYIGNNIHDYAQKG